MSISGIGGVASFFSTAGLARLNAEIDPTSFSAARTAFNAEAEKTPAERMREQLLARLGLKESDLANMSGEERKAVEAKLAEMIKEEVERSAQDSKPGKVLDVQA
jgi:hypothetical protein